MQEHKQKNICIYVSALEVHARTLTTAETNSISLYLSCALQQGEYVVKSLQGFNVRL